MKKAIGKKLLPSEEFDILLVETEGILNRRLICQVTDDWNEVLRPIDFLVPHTKMEDLDLAEEEEYLPPGTKNVARDVQRRFARTEDRLNQL